MLHPVGHRDLLREVRWTAEEAQRARDGIDLATLELSPSEAARVSHAAGARGRAAAARSGGAGRRSRSSPARRSSGRGGRPGDAPRASARTDQFAAGRAIQRAWLTATRRELALQPHTSALYLFARAFGGGAADFDAEALDELTALKARFESVVGAHDQPVFLFRLFPGCEPPARSLRRPVASMLSNAES